MVTDMWSEDGENEAPVENVLSVHYFENDFHFESKIELVFIMICWFIVHIYKINLESWFLSMIHTNDLTEEL